MRSFVKSHKSTIQSPSVSDRELATRTIQRAIAGPNARGQILVAAHCQSGPSGVGKLAASRFSSGVQYLRCPIYRKSAYFANTIAVTIPAYPTRQSQFHISNATGQSGRTSHRKSPFAESSRGSRIGSSSFVALVGGFLHDDDVFGCSSGRGFERSLARRIGRRCGSLRVRITKSTFTTAKPTLGNTSAITSVILATVLGVFSRGRYLHQRQLPHLTSSRSPKSNDAKLGGSAIIVDTERLHYRWST